MVILTGKAFRIVYQQIIFFSFYFSFSAEKRCFSFLFRFRQKKEIDFFSCFYFWAENGKFIFGWPLVPGFCHRKFLDLQIAMGGFEGIIIG